MKKNKFNEEMRTQFDNIYHVLENHQLSVFSVDTAKVIASDLRLVAENLDAVANVAEMEGIHE